MGKRILIVDDEPYILQVLSMKLGNAGFDVIKAADGEEAFELARTDPPDLVITDFQMPYMTGLELCIALRNEAATADIPVVMLTARGYALDDEDLAASNIREVISKPFGPRAMVDLVHKILGEESSTDQNEVPEAA